jgi:hypothetical protein
MTARTFSVTVTAPPPPPSGQTLFLMDLSAAGAVGELAGWGAAQTEALITRTYNPTGGPTGGGAYDLAHVVGAAGDNYYGWSNRTAANLVATAGQSRFYRLKYMWTAMSASGNIVNKLLIPHDSQNGNNERAIYQTQIDSTRILHGFQHDGGSSQITSTTAVILNTWIALQWEIRYSSTPGAANGYWKIWLNNSNYASPTLQQTIIQNVPSGSNNNLMRMGYMNTGISNGAHAFRIGGFEVSDTFSSTW